jgi:IS605 OrfB family transposase
MLARLYERINNKRRDFLHKTSSYYCSRYDLIFLERLRILNMTKNHRLARRILDSSWYTFKAMCYYKANRVVEVEPAYSSVDLFKLRLQGTKVTSSKDACMFKMSCSNGQGLQLCFEPSSERVAAITATGGTPGITPVETLMGSEKQEQKKPLPFQGVVVHLL